MKTKPESSNAPLSADDRAWIDAAWQEYKTSASNWIVSRIIATQGPHYGDAVILDVESQEGVALVRAGAAIYTPDATQEEKIKAIEQRDFRAKMIAAVPSLLRERFALRSALEAIEPLLAISFNPNPDEDDLFTVGRGRVQQLCNQARAALAMPKSGVQS